MKTTVVIPLYNKEKYIQRTINSVLNQKKPVDEILVIDDGSTDSSADVVRKIKDKRIRLLQQRNTGEGAARNRGLAEASNNLVALLDADDEWKPDFLMHINRLYKNYPDCGLYATAFETMLENGRIEQPHIKSIPMEPWIGIIPNLFYLLQYTPPFCSSSVAINKRYLDQIGGFPNGVKRGSDKIMWVQIGLKFPIAYSPSSQAIYHTEATNRVCNTYEHFEEMVLCKKMEELLNNNEVPKSVTQDFIDFYNIQQIITAKDLIKSGSSQKARVLLNKFKKSRKYQRSRYKWLIISLLPYSFVRILLKFNRAIILKS